MKPHAPAGLLTGLPARTSGGRETARERRLYLRLCQELRLLSAGQYAHVSRMVVEVGKLLGSWRQGLEARA